VLPSTQHFNEKSMSLDDTSRISIELAKEAALESFFITLRVHFKDCREPLAGDTRNPTRGT